MFAQNLLDVNNIIFLMVTKSSNSNFLTHFLKFLKRVLEQIIFFTQELFCNSLNFFTKNIEKGGFKRKQIFPNYTVLFS